MNEPEDFNDPEPETDTKDKSTEDFDNHASKDDIIANEEREIQKIIEEGEKAAKIAEEQRAAVPEEKVAESVPEDSKGLWKWFLAGIIIVLAVGIFFVGSKYSEQIELTDLQHTGHLAVYSPAEFLDGWKLENSYLSLADLPIEKKQEFLGFKNLTEISMWEFSRGGETIYVWLREFTDKTSAEANADEFSPMAWRVDDLSGLSLGDDGRIGIYKITGQDPLVAYVRDSNFIITAAYYNQDNTKYVSENLIKDKSFVVQLTKNILNKLSPELLA